MTKTLVRLAVAHRGAFAQATLVAAALIAGSASAADLPHRVAPAAPPAAFSWTGTYLGAAIGGEAFSNSWTTTAIGNPAAVLDGTQRQSMNSSAFRLAGILGYNYQLNASAVIGIEGDFAGVFGGRKLRSGIPGDIQNENILIGQGQVDAPLADSIRARSSWDGSLRGRIGFLITPTILAYATGGLAFQNASFSITCPGFLANARNASACVTGARAGSQSSTRVGGTIGLGIEAALDAHWLLRGQYRYSNFGSRSLTYFGGSADVITASVKTNTSIAEIGLAYKF